MHCCIIPSVATSAWVAEGSRILCSCFEGAGGGVVTQAALPPLEGVCLLIGPPLRYLSWEGIVFTSKILIPNMLKSFVVGQQYK